MLRSEIYQADSPCYAFCWSGDDQNLAIGGSKILTFKNIKPGIKDVVVRASDFGVVLLARWSRQENLIFTSQEDARYSVWDSLGRNLYTSDIYTQAFTQGQWT